LPIPSRIISGIHLRAQIELLGRARRAFGHDPAIERGAGDFLQRARRHDAMRDPARVRLAQQGAGRFGQIGGDDQALDRARIAHEQGLDRRQAGDAQDIPAMGRAGLGRLAAGKVRFSGHGARHSAGARAPPAPLALPRPAPTPIFAALSVREGFFG
jgi:hypothetical protein